jgi:putative cofactor-binding repeat protein
LKEPIDLTRARAVRIRGQGAATLVVTPGGAFSINRGISLAIEDLTILSLGRTAAISVRTALGLNLQRLIISVLDGKDAKGTAIALAGAVVGATIRDNVIVASVGVQGVDPARVLPLDAATPQTLMSATLRIEDNVMWCDQQAVSVTGPVVHVMATRITGNEISGSRLGAITMLGLSGPGVSMRISGNSLNVTGPGITAAVDGLWIEGNKLVCTRQRDDKQSVGAGITLRTGLDPGGADQCQILSNQISGFTGAAIAIQSPSQELLIKLNIIERCGNGIISEDEVKTASLSIENNHISDIGDSENRQDGVFVAGIGVLRADAATVSGNTIRRVGQQVPRAALFAGIAAASVQRLRVSGNDISDVAPTGNYVGLATGVMLRLPYAQAEVTFNHVSRDVQPSSKDGQALWYALLVGQQQSGSLGQRIGSYTAITIDDARTLVFGARRPYLVSMATGKDVAGASLSVLGNVLAARGRSPAVDVEASGDCLFNDNRCELRANIDGSAVRIASGTFIVNANRVRGGKVSIELVGDSKYMAVLGNITTGGIRPTLGERWDALNLIG